MIEICEQDIILLCRTDLHADLKERETPFYTCSWATLPVIVSESPHTPIVGREE